MCKKCMKNAWKIHEKLIKKYMKNAWNIPLVCIEIGFGRRQDSK